MPQRRHNRSFQLPQPDQLQRREASSRQSEPLDIFSSALSSAMHPPSLMSHLPLSTYSRLGTTVSMHRRHFQASMHPQFNPDNNPQIPSHSTPFPPQPPSDHFPQSSGSGPSSRRPPLRNNRKTPEQARYWETVLSTNLPSSVQAPATSAGPSFATPNVIPTTHNSGSAPARSKARTSHRMGSSSSASAGNGGGSTSQGTSRSLSESMETPNTQSAVSKRRRSTNTPLQCPECPQLFERRPELMTHMQNAHNPDRTYPCKYAGCQKVFGHRSSRSRHEKTHRTSLNQ